MALEKAINDAVAKQRAVTEALRREAEQIEEEIEEERRGQSADRAATE